MGIQTVCDLCGSVVRSDVLSKIKILGGCGFGREKKKYDLCPSCMQEFKRMCKGSASGGIGSWIIEENTINLTSSEYKLSCSCCNFLFNVTEDCEALRRTAEFSYCPSCGARNKISDKKKYREICELAENKIATQEKLRQQKELIERLKNETEY